MLDDEHAINISTSVASISHKYSIPYYRELIDNLPLETIECAFVYGSGAILQAGEDSSEKMVWNFKYNFLRLLLNFMF